MIYLDSSALMKLIRREAETAALQSWLAERRSESAATSELGRVEVLRAAGRSGRQAFAEAHVVVGDVDLVPLDRGVQDLATAVGGPHLRTLDALHLASAMLLRDHLTAFVAYDERLLGAATEAGLPVHAPGLPCRAGLP